MFSPPTFFIVCHFASRGETREIVCLHPTSGSVYTIATYVVHTDPGLHRRKLNTEEDDLKQFIRGEVNQPEAVMRSPARRTDTFPP